MEARATGKWRSARALKWSSAATHAIDPLESRDSRRHQTIRPSRQSVKSSAYLFRPPCLSAMTMVSPEVSGSHTRRNNFMCSRYRTVALLSVSRVAWFQRRGHDVAANGAEPHPRCFANASPFLCRTLSSPALAD